MLLRPSTKTRNRFALLKAYISKSSRVPGWPLTLTIESTAKCNLFCPMCLRQKVYFPPRDMDFPIFRKIIDEGKDFLEFAVPYGAGEPLLNPEIFDMIAYCKAHGLRSEISTNATLLNDERARRMAEPEMKVIARLISRVLHAPGDSNVLKQAREEVVALTNKFPLYPEKLAAIGK